MNINGLTNQELRTFRELLVKANNAQLEELVTLVIREDKDRMMRTPLNPISNEEVYL
jgi:hypothetical protein